MNRTLASDDHDDHLSRDNHTSDKTTASVCGASTGTMSFSMATHPKMVATPDWLIRHQRDEDALLNKEEQDHDLVSEASVDADDMSISDNSSEGDITEMFSHHTSSHHDNIDDTIDNLDNDDAMWDDCHGSHPQNITTPRYDQHIPLSQEQLDADRTDTERDVMEATDKIPPLLMRYCPDGTHCVATWNVNNCFHAETIVKIMLRCNISILIIQEPKHAPTTKTNEKFINKTLQKFGLRGFFSDFQYLIYNEAVLGARIKDFSKLVGGRVITFKLQIGNLNAKEFINFIGCYGAAHGNHKYNAKHKEYKYGKTRDIHRTNVFHILKKLLAKDYNKIRSTATGGVAGPSENIVGNILLGDLQETLSTTKRDNHNGIHYKPPKHGIFDALQNANKHMTSVIREYEGQERYITRESLSASKTGRGISHILVDPYIEDMYVGGCVDKMVASGAFPTDHHIVAADFPFDIENICLQETEPIERFKWGRIANILMTLVPSPDPNNAPSLQPKLDTPRTAEWDENYQLFQALQHELENDPELSAAADHFHSKMLTLQKTLIKATAALPPVEHENGILIERLPSYKSSLEDAWNIFLTSMKKVATKLGLRSEQDPITQLKDNINAYRSPNDIVGKLRSVATFTNIVGHTRYIRATCKALDCLDKVPLGKVKVVLFNFRQLQFGV